MQKGAKKNFHEPDSPELNLQKKCETLSNPESDKFQQKYDELFMKKGGIEI